MNKSCIAALLLSTARLCGQATNIGYVTSFVGGGGSATNTLFIDSLVVTNSYHMAITNIEFMADEIRLQTYKDWLYSFPATPEIKTNLVNSLISSGEFCRIRGHTWRPGCEMESDNVGCLVYHGGPTRTCRQCRKTETQYTEWK